MSTNLKKLVAELTIELADQAEDKLCAEGMCAWVGGYKGSIVDAFKLWRERLQEARKIHRQAGMTQHYKEWWSEPLGQLTKKTLMTRRTVAEYKRYPSYWSYTLLSKERKPDAAHRRSLAG